MMRADNRKLRGDLRKSEGMFARTFSKVAKGAKRRFSGVLGGITARAGAGFASIAGEVLDFEENLTRLGIQSGKSGADIEKFRAQIIQLSKQTGLSRGELLGAGVELVNLTGAAGLSIEKIELLGKANLATGASMKDLAGLAFTLDSAFGLESAADLEVALGAIVQAGKKGAVPLDQMAAVLQRVGGTFAEVSSAGIEGAAELAAALQVLRSRGFASAAEAGTGLEAVMAGVIQKQSQLQDKGIEVFAGGAKRDIIDILRDIDRAGLTEKERALIFVDKSSQKAVEAFLKDGLSMYDELKNAGLTAGNVLERDQETFARSTAGRLKKATNALKENIANVFTPERIEKFVDAMGAAADFAGFLVDHIREFALIFAGIKLAKFAATMSTIATKAGMAATGARGLAGSMGKAAGLAATFSTAFAAGTFLDETFKISDKISNLALGGAEFTGGGFLRERAEDVKASALQNFISQTIGGKAADPAEVLADAISLVRGSKERGITGETEAGRLAAARTTQKVGLTPFDLAQLKLTGKSTEKGEAFLRALEAAERIVAESTKLRKEKIQVEITINQAGVAAVTKERAEALE